MSQRDCMWYSSLVQREGLGLTFIWIKGDRAPNFISKTLICLAFRVSTFQIYYNFKIKPIIHGDKKPTLTNYHLQQASNRIVLEEHYPLSILRHVGTHPRERLKVYIVTIFSFSVPRWIIFAPLVSTYNSNSQFSSKYEISLGPTYIVWSKQALFLVFHIFQKMAWSRICDWRHAEMFFFIDLLARRRRRHDLEGMHEVAPRRTCHKALVMLSYDQSKLCF